VRKLVFFNVGTLSDCFSVLLIVLSNIGDVCYSIAAVKNDAFGLGFSAGGVEVRKFFLDFEG
jgi:hypothetical protein